MTHATKKTKAKDPLSELAAADRSERSEWQLQYERLLLAIARRDEVDQERLREVVRELGLSVADVTHDTKNCRSNISDINTLAAADECEDKLDEVKEQLADHRRKREELVGPLDTEIAQLEAFERRLSSSLTKRDAARRSLLGRARPFLNEEIDRRRREIRRAERKLTLIPQPERHEAVWRSDQWQALSDAPESQAAFRSWQQREGEWLAFRAAERVRIARLREQLQRIEQLVLTNPWPTAGDLAELLAEFDAEDKRLAEAERAAAQAAANEAEATAIASI